MKGYSTLNAPRDVHREVKSGFILSNTGEQGIKDLGYMGRNSDWALIYDKSLRTTTNVINLNPMGSSSNDQKLWIDGQRSEYLFTNQSPGMVELTIYDVLCKRQGTLYPAQSWQDGLTDAGGTDVVAEQKEMPGAIPTNSKSFNNNWRIIRTSKVFLTTGGHHKHVQKHYVNGIYQMSDGFGLPANTVMPGYTMYCLGVLKGMPADTAASSGAGTVTVAPAKVVYTHNILAYTRILSLKSRHIDFTNTLSSAPGQNLYEQNPHGLGIHDVAANTVSSLIAFA